MRYSIFIILFLLSCAHKPVEKIIPKKVSHKAPSLKKKKVCQKQRKAFWQLTHFHSNVKLKQSIENTNCEKNLERSLSYYQGHANTIGIIYSGQDDFKNKAILQGIKEANSQNKFFIIKVPRQSEAVNKAIAKLVLTKKIGLLITWGDKEIIELTQKWEEALNLPTLYIHQKIEKHPYALKVYPNKANYAFELIKKVRAKNIKRIAFLTPKKYQDSQFIKDIKRVFKAAKIEVVFDEVYNSQSYDEMDFICRKIFVINRIKRRDEYVSILKKEKQRANVQGLKVNKRLAFLPAQVNFDAIFIPDNFKIVNHFVKLFEYYQAEKIPLIGTHEWRSPALVSTNKNYLNGSFFVDFIKTPASKHNANQDYKLMGHYSSKIAGYAIKKSKKNKKKLIESLRRLRLSKTENAFRRNEFNWPVFAFEIQDKSIRPIQ